jgi:hypothetical protein
MNDVADTVIIGAGVTDDKSPDFFWVVVGVEVC